MKSQRENGDLARRSAGSAARFRRTVRTSSGLDSLRDLDYVGLRGRFGLTVIELMVVIAIVSVLISLIVPAVMNARG